MLPCASLLLPHKIRWYIVSEQSSSFQVRKALTGVSSILPTGRFLAESKYKISSADERPSLAWSLSALMSASTCKVKKVSVGVCLEECTLFLTVFKKIKVRNNLIHTEELNWRLPNDKTIIPHNQLKWSTRMTCSPQIPMLQQVQNSKVSEQE